MYTIKDPINRTNSPSPPPFFFNVVQYPSMDVVFQAKTWALRRDGKGSKVLLFDVILEENVLGIPVSALQLVIAAVVAAAVS